MLVGYIFSTFHPNTIQQRADTIAWLQAVADPNASDHELARTWLRREMAHGIVRKIVVAAEKGLSGINIGNFEDWSSGVPSVDRALVPAIGSSAFMGMIDRTKTDEYAGAPLPYTQSEFSRINEAGEKRPAFYALTLVAQKMAGFTTVRQLDLGEGIWAYRYERQGDSHWVLWHDDGELTLLGESDFRVSVTSEFPAERAQITKRRRKKTRICP